MQRPESVVITGIGIASPVGNDLAQVMQALRTGRSGIRAIPEWRGVDGLAVAVGGLVEGIDLQAAIPRKYRRSMGRVAQLCAYATDRAIADAGLASELVQGGNVGLAVGSTTGSPAATLEYYRNLLGPGARANKATAFLQVMSHTCAANVALCFGITGRVWGPNSACTSASQAIGLGFETLRAGAQDVMICGGAEEVHFTTAVTFNLAGAASTGFNDAPTSTPRPFDARRDGMVVGEGAGVLVLEREAHARARQARIYGEVVGFSTTCDGEHITSPAEAGMVRAMELGLKSAGLAASDIDYINAHATGTSLGDSTEARATARVFGDRVPVSSTKGHIGHTLGACGAIESVFVLGMMKEGFVAPTLNLETIDPECAGVWHLQAPLERRVRHAINNNFAFGGINTSLVLRGA
jgi:3-oxoacyl-[acyl-carrier-protein] synthase II